MHFHDVYVTFHGSSFLLQPQLERGAIHGTIIDSEISNIKLQIIRVMPILWRSSMYICLDIDPCHMREAEICWSAFY